METLGKVQVVSIMAASLWLCKVLHFSRPDLHIHDPSSGFGDQNPET